MKTIVKATVNGEIEIGYYVERPVGNHFIIPIGGDQGMQVKPDTIKLRSPIQDKNGTGLYEDDVILDELTKRSFTIKYGFCKEYAYTGWYCEADDGYQCPLNNDSDSDRNSQIIFVQ